MITMKMSITERAAISRKHNPGRRWGETYMTNAEMNDLILNVYGINKLTDDPMDLTFQVVDDKKYLMYLLTR